MLVISPDGRDGSAEIAQDAFVCRLLTEQPETIRHDTAGGRGVWLHLIRGEARIGDVILRAGDAVAIEEAGHLEIQTGPDGHEALLFELG